MELEAVIGLEVHAHMATSSKMFCSCATTFGTEQNTQTCPVCIGMPGVLPVINKQAVELSLRTAVALNCEITQNNCFDRKGYYYPDLPKNYQVSQNYRNLGVNGHIDIRSNASTSGDAQTKRVRIHNVHMEEDAGKLIHPEDPRANYSLVDLNRAGTPLLEIVTEPDMSSSQEADSYMHTLRDLLICLGVSECRMEQGGLRFEASISMRPVGTTKLGNRVEIKNLNSMRSVVRGIEHEIERQSKVITEGGSIPSETRLWDEVRQVSAAMRAKEAAQDYRYFPDPDLVDLNIDDKWLADVKASLPELPQARRQRFIDILGLPEYDADVLMQDLDIADYFEECLSHLSDESSKAWPKIASNWVMGSVLATLNEKKISLAEFPISPAALCELMLLVEKGTVSRKMARDEVFPAMVDSSQSAEIIINERNLGQVSDQSEITPIIEKVIRANPGPVEDYKSGKKNALNFLFGQVMREAKGKADPNVVRQLLQDTLS